MAYYALNVSVTGASSGVFCSVNLTEGQILAGAGQTTPRSAGYTYMSFQSAISFQVPPGNTSCGATVDASSRVSGTVVVSPAIDVAVVVALWGRGKVLGTYDLPAGETNGEFSFEVDAAEAFPPDQIGDALKQIIKPVE